MTLGDDDKPPDGVVVVVGKGMGNLLPSPKGDPCIGMCMSMFPGLGNLKLVKTACGDPCMSRMSALLLPIWPENWRREKRQFFKKHFSNIKDHVSCC
jgi:hypothetical protein